MPVVRNEMSSLSHQQSLTIAEPRPHNKTKPTVQDNQRLLAAPNAAAIKNAKTKSSGPNHLHGNCTNCNLGSQRQARTLTGNIIRVPMDPSANSAHQASGNSLRLRATTIAAMLVARITPIAIVETFQLKNKNSGLSAWTYKKLWSGRSR